MCSDVMKMNIKSDSVFEPKCIPQASLNSRCVGKSEHKDKSEIIAFIFDETSFNLSRQVYNGSTWEALLSLKIPYEPYAIVQSSDSWIIFTKYRSVLCIDKSSLVITNAPDVPVNVGDNFSVEASNSCIYVIGTFMNNTDYTLIYK